MKKALSFLLVMVIAVSGLTLVGDAAATKFSPDDVISFTILADESYTNKLDKFSDKNRIELLGNLLSTATPVNSFPKDYMVEATIQVELKDNITAKYNLINLEDKLYIIRGVQIMEADWDAWLSFHRSLSSVIYKYSALPVIALNKNTIPISKTKESYQYKAIDGLFWQTYVAEQTPPTINLESGEKPIFSFSVTPEKVHITLSRNGKGVEFDDVESFRNHVPQQGGIYTCVIKATYDSEYYSGEVIAPFSIHYKTNQVNFSIKGASTYPGEVAVIRATNVPEGENIKFAASLSAVPNFFKVAQGEYIAFLPISYYTDVGTHKITLSVGQNSQEFSIIVNDKTFQIQNLTASSETTAQTILSKKANEEFEENIAPIRYAADNKAYWQNSGFSWPTTGGRVTTQFGMIRYVNGSPTSSRHGAIDIALPRGTRVGATSNGRILYAGFLQLTGNTVVIEHGYGLKSWYYHMDKLSVITGNTVEKGTKIGEVGTTGFSTGNHLHFGFSVNNVFVNPTTIIETDIITG